VFFVDKGNSDHLSFTVEVVSSKPASANVGVNEAVTSRGGIDGVQTKLEPPSRHASTSAFEAIIEFGPLGEQMKGYMRSRTRRTSCLGVVGVGGSI